MFKGTWRSVLKKWQLLLGSTPQKALTAAADLPPLADPDYEYLFMQLLEGVSHGWQQPRAIEFFRKIRHRAPKSQWLAWLNNFGSREVNATAPNEELARRMIQLGDLDCSEVTSLASEYGHQILGKIYGSIDDDEYLTEISAEDLAGLGLLNALELSNDFELSSNDLIPEPELSLELPPTEQELELVMPEPLYKSRSPLSDLVESETDFPAFGEVPENLRLGSNNKRPVPPPPPSGFLQPISLETSEPSPELPAESEPVQEQEISIEEFAIMLQSDPELLQDISKQLGIETTDPQVVVNTVIAQMQQQIADGQNNHA